MSRPVYKPFVVASIAPRVAVHALPVTHGPLRIVVEPREAPALSGAALGRWLQLQAENPKYFDGPILAVRQLPAGDNKIVASVDRYARLAVQPEVATGVRMLAVTGVLLASDASGREHVLVGKRAKNVRCYPGMWEIGPSGGLAPTSELLQVANGEQAIVLHEEHVVAQLAQEIEEEIGLCVRDKSARDISRGADASGERAGQSQRHGGMLHSRARATSVAILSDGVASSDDIVVVVNLAIEAHELMRELLPANWEYDEVRLVPLDALGEFDEHHASEIIPPSRVLMRAMGWMERE